MAKVKRFYNGMALESLSADPSSPVEGQIQFADGTARAKGLWQYKDGGWAAIGGGGAGSPSIFKSFDFDNDQVTDWTESAGTLAEDTTTNLSGDKSLKWTPNALNDTLDSPSITIPERTKDVAGLIPCAASFVYSASDDGFQVIIKDNASNVLATHDVDSTKNRAQVFFNLTGSETSLTMQVKDATHTASMNIILDDIVFDDEPLAKTATISKQTYLISQAGNGVTNGAAEIEFNLGTATITDVGEALIEAVDDSGNTRTKFVAKRDCTLSGSFAAGVGAGSSVSFYKNGTLFKRGSSSYTAGGFAECSVEMSLSAGDFFSVEGTLTAQADLIYMSFEAIATNDSVIVENALGSEWTDAGEMTIEGTGSNPTKATTREVDKILYRRVGDSAEILFEYEAASSTGAAAGTGYYKYKMPSGLKIDMTHINPSNGDYTGTVVGHGRVGRTSYSISTTEAYTCHVKVFDEDYLVVWYQIGTNTQSYTGGTRQPLNTDNYLMQLNLTVPIQGWTSVQNHVMDIADPYENTYSASIANNGTVSLNSASGSWISASHLSRSATGITSIDITHLGLTVTPSANVTVHGTGSEQAYVSSASTTTIQITTENSTSGADADLDYDIIIQRQGADHRSPQGYFIGQAAPVRTAHIDMTNFRNTVAATTAYKDWSFSTVSGDSGFVSLSSGDLVVQAGTYEMTVPVGANAQNGQTSLRVYNNTDAAAVEEFTNVVYSNADNDAWNHVKLRFVLTGTKTIKIQTKAQGTSGVELMSRVSITKVK